MIVSSRLIPKGIGMLKLVSCLFLGALFVAPSGFADDTKVFLQGNEIQYEGELSKAANENVFKIFEESGEKVEWISIKSAGGEVNIGMDLGEFVFSNNLNIKVLDFCLSSCANYVFSSGKNKLIGKHAVIGFHGGVTGMEAAVEEFISSAPEGEREAVRQQFEGYIVKTTEREAFFFSKIEVEQSITTLGQSEEYSKVEGIEDYVGWYYSLEDLSKLGVNNISVVNPPWSFKQLSEKSKFYKLEPFNL